MSRQRRIAITLLGAAVVAWLAVLLVGLTVDPSGSSSAALIGAVALGVATGLTAAPLFWLISFATTAGSPIAATGCGPHAAAPGSARSSRCSW